MGSKKPRKSYVSESDISTLVHRYSATDLLAMLQEVAQVNDFNLDWNQLVEKTTTGITNPREYQMLWRHLAYGDALFDKGGGGSEPLDDESDLECELEAFPPANAESLAEASACVKVLMTSRTSNDASGSILESPLTINIPKVQMPKVTKVHGGSSVSSVKNQPHPPPPAATAPEGLDSNSTSSANVVKRKRKQWTDEEDAKLIAAMDKRTDPSSTNKRTDPNSTNWGHISKTVFDGDRTPSMLVQRWAFIKKRDNLQTGNTAQPSEVQLAARKAMAMALDPGNPLKSSSNVTVANGSVTQPSESLPPSPTCVALSKAAATSPSLPPPSLTGVPSSKVGIASGPSPSMPPSLPGVPKVGIASGPSNLVAASKKTGGLAVGKHQGGSSNPTVAAHKRLAAQVTQPKSGLATQVTQPISGPATQATPPKSGHGHPITATSTKSGHPITITTKRPVPQVSQQNGSNTAALKRPATQANSNPPIIAKVPSTKKLTQANPNPQSVAKGPATKKQTTQANSIPPMVAKVPETHSVGTHSDAATKIAVKKPKLSPDSMVKAAAVAAGARIATPSAAATLRKAAQARNAVHIVPGSSPPKPSTTPVSPTPLPSNVHFIRRAPGPGGMPKATLVPKIQHVPSPKTSAPILFRLPTSAPDSTKEIEVKNSVEVATATAMAEDSNKVAKSNVSEVEPENQPVAMDIDNPKPPEKQPNAA